jgi:ribonuclease R
MRVGHFALASTHYCHFTSPIRRYPDLTVHRLVRDYVAGRIDEHKTDDAADLQELGEHCTGTERTASAAENDLRDVLVLQFLQTKVGESFEGVVTGVANFGIFVQSPRFLVEGLIRLEDLGDDWWEVSGPQGQVVGEVSGRKYRVGDLLEVRIASVDIAMRQLDLVPVRGTQPKRGKPTGKSGKGKSGKGKGGKSGKKGKSRGKAKGQAGKSNQSRRKGRGKKNRGKKNR